MMKHHSNQNHGTRECRFSISQLAAFIIPLALTQLASAEPVDGFTEPYRTIEVASAETGIIIKVLVKEGERVQRGQIVAKLDASVLQSRLEIAIRESLARGAIETAQAEFQLRKKRLHKLLQLRTNGIVRQVEVERAKADLAITEAQVLAAEDAIAIKRLECKRIQAQINQRIVYSPIDGVVNTIHKEEGEQVSTADPHVVTIVQLDPLLAIFSLSTPQAMQLRSNQNITIHPTKISSNGISSSPTVTGIVEHVAPVTHAESSTVLVTVRFENSEGLFRSGERCWLNTISTDKPNDFVEQELPKN